VVAEKMVAEVADLWAEIHCEMAEVSLSYFLI